MQQAGQVESLAGPQRGCPEAQRVGLPRHSLRLRAGPGSGGRSQTRGSSTKLEVRSTVSRLSISRKRRKVKYDWIPVPKRPVGEQRVGHGAPSQAQRGSQGPATQRCGLGLAGPLVSGPPTGGPSQYL